MVRLTRTPFLALRAYPAIEFALHDLRELGHLPVRLSGSVNTSARATGVIGKSPIPFLQLGAHGAAEGTVLERRDLGGRVR